MRNDRFRSSANLNKTHLLSFTNSISQKAEQKQQPNKHEATRGNNISLTHKFDLYPALKRRWQLSPYWWALRWDAEHVRRNAGSRAAAARGSDGALGWAAEARAGPRT